MAFYHEGLNQRDEVVATCLRTALMRRVRTHRFPLCRMTHGSNTNGDMSDLYWLSDAQMMVGLAAEHDEKRTVMIDATYLKAHRTATSMGMKKGGVDA